MSLPLLPLPAPKEISFGDGRFHVSPRLTVKGEVEGLVGGLAAEWARDLEQLFGTSVTIADAGGERPDLTLTCKSPKASFPTETSLERYQLHVTPTGLSLSAPSPIGIRYGFQTLLQLCYEEEGALFLPQVDIADEPRFNWRGVMLDVGRHFMDMDVVRRIVDGMGRAKLNVLHFGLSNNQGFRVESKRFPRLHKVASAGQYYSQEEIRALIAYAGARGVRVVPEFNMPGHSTAFLVAYPELASGPAPDALRTTSGVFDDEMNPASAHTDKFVGAFLEEMTALFPDAYYHFGGDEVTGKSWAEDGSVQAFMEEMGLETKEDLQALFTMRLQGHLARLGKKSAAWEEVADGHPSPDTLIMPWIAPASDPKFDGYPLVVANGYYLDHFFRARDYYAIDPEAEDCVRDVQGAEMCLWSEVMNGDTVEALLWRSGLALAERFWSPREALTPETLEARLSEGLSFLSRLGAADLAAPDRLAAQLCGGRVPRAVETLRDYVGPHVYYFALDRTANPHDVNAPFDRLIETLRPETAALRRFEALVDEALHADMKPLKDELERLTHLGADFERAVEALPGLQENQPVADALSELAEEALKALAGEDNHLAELIERLEGPKTPDLHGVLEALGRRRQKDQPLILRETLILILPALKRLFQHAP